MTPALVFVLGLLGLVVGEAIKLWQDGASPLLSSGLAVVGGAVPLLIDFVKDLGGRADERGRVRPGPYPHHPGLHRPGYHQPGYPHQPGYQQPGHPPPRPRPDAPRPLARTGSLLVKLVALVVIGGAAAYGISYGVSWGTGNETVQDERLAAPATGRAGKLTVRVNSVGITAHYTKVAVTATNQSQASLTLPLFGYCQLIDAAGAILRPGTPFGGRSPITVPANGTLIATVITFDGKPTAGGTTLTLSFDALFPAGPGFTEPSLQVRDIELEPADQ